MTSPTCLAVSRIRSARRDQCQPPRAPRDRQPRRDCRRRGDSDRARVAAVAYFRVRWAGSSRPPFHVVCGVRAVAVRPGRPEPSGGQYRAAGRYAHDVLDRRARSRRGACDSRRGEQDVAPGRQRDRPARAPDPGRRRRGAVRRSTRRARSIRRRPVGRSLGNSSPTDSSCRPKPAELELKRSPRRRRHVAAPLRRAPLRPLLGAREARTGTAGAAASPRAAAPPTFAAAAPSSRHRAATASPIKPPRHRRSKPVARSAARRPGTTMRQSARVVATYARAIETKDLALVPLDEAEPGADEEAAHPTGVSRRDVTEGQHHHRVHRTQRRSGCSASSGGRTSSRPADAAKRRRASRR